MRITQNVRRATQILIFLVAAFSAKADGLWGVKASFDINKPSKWHGKETSFKMYDSGLGFSLGAVYSNYFNDNLFLEPSISFFYDTYSCDFTIINAGDSGTVDAGIYKAGIRLPVVVGYTFDITDDFALSVFTGPEFDYAFAGGYRLKDKRFKDELGSFFGNDGVQRRFYCAWKGGIGFPFSDWRVDFEASVGLTDILNGSVSCRENRFSLSLLRYF